jgi:carboxymethylenebutenolidase
MIEKEIFIDTGEGQMNTFIVHPDENGPHPVILFLMDAPGKREELHQMARRIATCGYWVMLPNLYYRRVDEFIMDGSEASRAVMFEHMNSLSNVMVVQDCMHLLETAAEYESASKGYAGCLGYCMSGPFAFAAAAKINQRIRAAASIHGVRLFTDSEESPHLNAHQVMGELYFGCAETDEWAPRELINNLENHLSRTGVHYRIEWYPNTEHGFVFPEREGKYHQNASERHWHRILSLFERNLK